MYRLSLMLILVFIVSACTCKPREMYSYRPTTSNELPAKVQIGAVITGTYTSMLGNDQRPLLRAGIDQINGLWTYNTCEVLTETLAQREQRRLQLIEINPGLNKITIGVSGAVTTFLANNTKTHGSFTKEFYAQPGEVYRLSGGGTDSQPTVWLENSKGEKIFALSLRRG